MIKRSVHIAFAGCMVASLSAGTLAQDTQCERCNKELVLNAAQFECLKKKLPGLSKWETRFVFFTLPEPCRGSRSVVTRLPSTDPDAPPSFRVRQSDIRCLEQKISRVRKRGEQYKIKFADLCGG